MICSPYDDSFIFLLSLIGGAYHILLQPFLVCISLLNRLAESFNVYLAVFFQHACFDEEVLGLRKVFYVSIGDGRVEIVPASHSLYLVFREARFRGGCAVVFLTY